MLMKHFLAISLTVFSVTTQAFDYFDEGINYWDDEESVKIHESVQKKDNVDTGNTSNFKWKDYLDTNNPEMFREGNHTPPIPFLYTGNNPTDENIELLLKYVKKKNEFISQFQNKIADYQRRKNGRSPLARKALASNTLKAINIAQSSKAIWFLMYYESSCPFCKKMFGVLKDLQSRGYYVEGKQIDSDPKGLTGRPVRVSLANKEEVKKLNIKGVPLLLVLNKSNKTQIKIQGFHTIEKINEAVKGTWNINL